MNLSIAHAGFIVRAEGKSVWVDVDYADSAPQRAPSSTQSGQFERIVGTARDIIELKRPREALRMSEEFASTVLENSPDCVRMPDAAGRLLTRWTVRDCAAWRSAFLRPGTAPGHTKQRLDAGLLLLSDRAAQG